MSNDRLKFRVWDVYRNKMIWGNCNLMLNLDGYKLWQVEHDTPRFIVEQSKFILMQCTGIKDKTGKLIFESDIVKSGENWEGVVWWCEDRLQWWCDDHDLAGLRALEVIRNIYEKNAKKEVE